MCSVASKGTEIKPDLTVDKAKVTSAIRATISQEKDDVYIRDKETLTIQVF